MTALDTDEAKKIVGQFLLLLHENQAVYMAYHESLYEPQTTVSPRDGELHRWLQVNGHDDRWEHMQPTDGGVQYGSEAEFG